MLPGVGIIEKNMGYTSANSGCVSSFIGIFEKGPINTPVLITSINEFKMTFGRGKFGNYNDWYQVYNYLQYSNKIIVIRSSGSSSINGNILGQNILIKNEEDSEDSLPTTNEMNFIAKTPGEWSNILKIVVQDSNNYDKSVFKYVKDYCVIVYRKDVVVDSFRFKLGDKIESNYVYMVGTEITLGEFNISNGVTSNPAHSDLSESYSILDEVDNIVIDSIIGNDVDNNLAIQVAEKRKDCVAYIGIPYKTMEFLSTIINGELSYITTNAGQLIIANEFKNLFKSESDKENIDSYINEIDKSMFANFTLDLKLQFNGFTNKYEIFNIAGDVAGNASRAYNIAPWTPPAGLNNGLLKNYKKLIYEMGEIEKYKYYEQGVNLIAHERGVAYISTQKTLGCGNFTDLNIRVLFNYIERQSKLIMGEFLFKENSNHTRNIISVRLNQLLSEIKSGRGLEDSYIEIKGEMNSLTVDIYIKPLYAIEYIQLTLTNTNTQTTSVTK